MNNHQKDVLEVAKKYYNAGFSVNFKDPVVEKNFIKWKNKKQRKLAKKAAKK